MQPAVAELNNNNPTDPTARREVPGSGSGEHRHRHRHRHHHHHYRYCKKHGKFHAKSSSSSDKMADELARAKRRSSAGRKKNLVEDSVQQAERVAREKRKSENGVVKKRTTPERRRESSRRESSRRDGRNERKRRGRRKEDARIVEEEERTKRKSSESRKKEEARRAERKKKQERARRMERIKRLKAEGRLVRARRFVTRALALESEGYSEEMLDVVGARVLFKMYLQCRERVAGIGDTLAEGGRRVQDGKLRRRLMDEEAELNELVRAQRVVSEDGRERGEERRALRKRRRGLERFVADELGSEAGELRDMSRSELGKVALVAVVNRARRMESCEYDTAGLFY